MVVRSCIAFVVVCASAAQADVLLHRQAPGRTGGFTADSLVTADFGQSFGQLVADKFTFGSDSSICRINSYGFFGGDLMLDPGPPIAETLRIRFYADSAGLPGDMLFETDFADPSRTWTGQFINISGARKEYLYQFPLSECFSAHSGTVYWLEIAQVGDGSSQFRWESSNTGNEFAVRFPIETPYRLVNGIGQMAYELWTPEPGSGVLVGLAALMLRRRGKCG